jgi:hypothetical protein
MTRYNYNDIVEIEEQVAMFNNSLKSMTKKYLVKSISINQLVIEDIDNPLIRKSVHPSQILTINGMTIKRNAKV